MPFWSSKKKADAKGSVETAEVSSWRVLAEQCIDQGNHVDAINFYTAILSKHPKDVPALLGRSMARMLPEPISYDLAIKDADAAIDAKHDSWQAWKQKGRVLAAAGRPGEAEQALQHAMRLASSADLFGIRELLNQVKQQRSIMQMKSPAGTSTLSPASLSPLPSGSRSPLVTPTDLPPDSHSSPAMLPNTSAAPVQQASTSDSAVPPSDPPPVYTSAQAYVSPATRSTIPGNEPWEPTFKEQLNTKGKGQVVLTAQTLTNKLDQVHLTHEGYTATQSALLDMSIINEPAPSLDRHCVTLASFPGNNYIDQDPETHVRYMGVIPGTLSVFGGNEEYRIAQLQDNPGVALLLETVHVPPRPEIKTIMDRLTKMRTNWQDEDNAGLFKLLNYPSTEAAFVAETRQWHISAIAMILNYCIFTQPARFAKLSKAGSIAMHFFRAANEATGQIGLHDFLFQILLGAELLLRLHKEPSTTSYANIIGDEVSATIIIARHWVTGVECRPNPNPGPGGPNNFINSLTHSAHTNALMQFAETIRWPYMNETRTFIRGVYQKLISTPLEVNNFLRDWIYGTHRPGKIFRNLLMTVLVESTPSIKSIGWSRLYLDGLVLPNGHSYWPARSTLGRVLGGLRGVTQSCGIIGPVKIPISGLVAPKWCYSQAAELPIPVPRSPNLNELLSALGLGATSTQAKLNLVTDPIGGFTASNQDITQYRPPRDLPPRTNPVSSATLKAINLVAPSQPLNVAADSTVRAPNYSATLTFLLSPSTRTASFTLHSTPVFITAPKCIGDEHPIHSSVVEKVFQRIIKASDLPGADPTRNEMIIVDARGEGEEVLARAWCAERERHAVVWRPGRCCFTCLVRLVSKEEGLGYLVVIWGAE